jgi:hypothetical protein
MDQVVDLSTLWKNKIYLQMKIFKEGIHKQDVSQWLIKGRIQMEASFS